MRIADKVMLGSQVDLVLGSAVGKQDGFTDGTNVGASDKSLNGRLEGT